jgi:serine phosphatase RsbU (regulator of sigma subunit)/anti-sigma regulatory factor (Ser/Thr protein kinase)
LLVADIVGALDPLDTVAGMAQRLVDELVPRFADYASLEIPDSAEPVVALAHRDPEMLHVLRLLREGHRLERDDAHSISRAAAGEAQLISRITPDTLHEYAREDESVELLTRLGPRSHIAVPVDVLGDRGALLVGLSDETRRPYTDHELELAQEIALRAGALLGRALAREDERSVAVRLQEVLLPEALPVHPSLQVAARYQSGSAQLQVGGDWYDAFMLSGGRIAFSVGDVVGHGLEAAAAMGRLRVALAALALNSEAPAEVVTRLDEFSCGVGGVDFATVCYALLDSATGVVRYAAAGHPPLLVVSADGQTQWLSGGRSAPLGIERDESIRPEAACTLQPGDLVIAYSDGLIERRGESIDGGLERLEAQARTLFASPVDDVCRRLIETLVTGASNDDDVVVLCLRFSPVTAANFHRVMPARPEELAPTRAALGAWITEHHPSANLEDLLIATGEALANAVEHAYDDPSQGVVRLTVAANFDGGLDVEVRDHGRWRAGQTDDRGHGTRIMSQLADEFSRHTGDEGTTVSFTMPARGPVSLAGRWLK